MVFMAKNEEHWEMKIECTHIQIWVQDFLPSHQNLMELVLSPLTIDSDLCGEYFLIVYTGILKEV